MFRPATARRDLERYRAKGLDALERRMLSYASEGELEGARVLEIGGGIGAMQAELLEAGAESGEIVELVESYEPYAYELAREMGLEGRVSYRVADILEHPDAVRPADVVVLNRVVCCSPDGVELAAAAARLTRRTLLLSFPRDVVWVRAAVRLLNAGYWVVRRSFRTFVHPPPTLVAAVEADGLRLAGRFEDGFWELTAFRRA
jgi:magnesium-protoporphyrin O-methyltransferase